MSCANVLPNTELTLLYRVTTQRDASKNHVNRMKKHSMCAENPRFIQSFKKNQQENNKEFPKKKKKKKELPLT